MPDERTPNFSTVTQVRDFFEVFLPGLFLFLHIVVLVHCALPSKTAPGWADLTENKFGVAAAVGLPCGYVLGLALRLGRTSFADRWSGRLLAFLPTQIHNGSRLLVRAREWWESEKHGDIILEPRRRDSKLVNWIGKTGSS